MKISKLVELINRFGDEKAKDMTIVDIYPKGRGNTHKRVRIKYSKLYYTLARSKYAYKVFYSKGRNGYHTYINIEILSYIERKIRLLKAK